MRHAGIILAVLATLGGCALSSGVVPAGPGVYRASEMRAPVLGGGPEAQRVVLAEATAFCGAQGRIFVPLLMGPGGDPRTPYFPTEFDATFRCASPDDPVVARLKAAGSIK